MIRYLCAAAFTTLLALGAPAGAVIAPSTADSVDFAGRGVYGFASSSGCPFSARAASNLCNRLALDDADTQVRVDTALHVIAFNNTRHYAQDTIVGDALLQGSGLDAGGTRVPLSYHLVLTRSGDKWSFSGHAHEPVGGHFTAVRIDPYQVSVNDSSAKEGRRLLVDEAAITNTLLHPPLSAWMARQLVQVKANSATGADITIALGVGQLATPVMRARLEGNPPGGNGVDMVPATGDWSVRLDALTGQIPDKVARRELFLFGLDGQPLLKPLVQRGFDKHETLIIGAAGGKGYLRYGGRQQDFPGADGAARAFMQQSFIGLILGWRQLGTDPAALANAHVR